MATRSQIGMGLCRRKAAGILLVVRQMVTMTYELVLGDCLEYMRTMKDKSIDLIATDPQYGIGADKKNAHSTIRDNRDWDNFNWDSKRPLKLFFDECLRVAKYCAFWGGNYFADLLPASGAWLVWRKPQAETGFSLSDAELCWTNGDFSTRVITSNRRDGNDHPTQKTIAVMNWTIEKFKLQSGAKIFDPCMGVGTTGVSCQLLGYDFLGCEIIENYYSIAQKRINNASKQMPLAPLYKQPQATQAELI